MNKLAIALVFVVTTATAIALALRFVHVAINTSTSMPLGFYQIREVDRLPRRGDIVTACAPPPAARLGAARGYLPKGSCRAGTAPLLKFVVAIGGDTVRLAASGVTINGKHLPKSQPLSKDSDGRPIHAYGRARTTLAASDVWLYAPQRFSYDSRYFGPVSRADVSGFATNLWTVSP